MSGLQDGSAAIRRHDRLLRCMAVKSLGRYREMQRALRETDGALLHSDLLALKRSLGVFTGKCDELLGFLRTTDDPDDQLRALQLWSLDNREGFDRFLDEVDRLLHNAVAAAMSLREHSYRVRDKWLQPGHADRLREKHDQHVRQVFTQSETAQLVHGLRNIIQHRKLPRLLGHAGWTRGGPFTSEIHVDADDLLEWDGWTPEMRDALERGEPPVELGEIITAHRYSVVGFHDWFGVALRERNAETLETLERDRMELARYASGMFGPPMSDPTEGPD